MKNKFYLIRDSTEVKNRTVVNSSTRSEDAKNFNALVGINQPLGVIKRGMGVVGGGAAAPNVITDTFTDADATDLAAHIPDVAPAGSAWESLLSTITISSNKATGGAGGTNTSSYVIDLHESDVDVSVALLKNSTDANHIIIRSTDVNNQWRIGYQSNGVFRIAEVNAGTLTVRASNDKVTAAGEHTIRVLAVGNIITAWLDGGRKLTYTSTFNQTATKIGIRLVGTDTADNLQASKGVAESSEPLGGWEGDDWTLIHLPDSQLMVETYPAMFDAQTQWCADNAVGSNIQMVYHSGDIVETRTVPVEQEWTDADEAFDILDTAEVPYLATQGNHDFDNRGATDVRDLTHFLATFPQARYTAHAWWSGGFYEAGRTENAYNLATISGKDYAFITLEEFPRDAVLTWLDGLLTTYAARDVILVTHGYLGLDSTLILTGEAYGPQEYAITDMNDAGAIWNIIKTHNNVVLILSGHIMDASGLGSVRLTSYSDGGYSVHQIASTFHMPDDVTHSGYLRRYKIRPSIGKIEVTTYSPAIDASKTDADNQFTLDYRLRI